MKLQTQASQVENFGKALLSLGVEHEELVVLDPDVSVSTKTTYFAESFPERFIRVGISEQDMMGIAAGLAASGKTPVACGFSMFVTGKAWDQVANSIAKPGLNVKIVGTHGGLSPSADGASHQAFVDVALMRAIPNMRVVVPADAPEAVEALRTLVDWYGPAYLRLGKGSSPVIYDEGCDFSLGKAIVLRDGSDATIIANGIMVSLALRAADQLVLDRVDARVLDMHTVKPLDDVTIEKAAAETGAIVAAEEHSVIGGLGSAVAEALAESKPTPMNRVGIQDRFGESSRSYDELMGALGLTTDAIADAVRKAMKRRDDAGGIY
ncbi:transketolase family protein [Candidatus Bathyarchaeota archaeon]|nr:transketolase family protein [Candidatus Bathyarchaeota archaeon]